MNTSTALNHYRRLYERAQSIYRSARCFGWSHEKLLKEYKEKVHNDRAWAKVPRWVRERIRTATSIWLSEFYKPDLHYKELERLLATPEADRKPTAYLRWQHRLDGEFVTLDEVFAARDAGDVDALSRIESTHIWNHTLTPFSPWEKQHKSTEHSERLKRCDSQGTIK